MKGKSIRLFIIIIAVLILGIFLGFIIRHNRTTWSIIKTSLTGSYKEYFDNHKAKWSTDFELVEIESSLDQQIQKAYFYKTKSKNKQAMVVSLHAWFGNYSRYEQLANLCKQRDINYIHPDFRGPNNTKEACCSNLALSDIDESIQYAIQHANVDTSKIYIIGFSGGGYAALSTFMKSRYKIKKLSVWAPVTDLEAWYHECTISRNKYVTSILQCTESSDGVLNVKIARERSPLFGFIHPNKLSETQISIYAGAYDGVVGEVPITHSINFYNKLLNVSMVKDTSKYITNYEKLQLLEYRKPMGNFENIANRKVFLTKTHRLLKITIYEGNHDFLYEYALGELLNDENK